jgi:hypothetical protein
MKKILGCRIYLPHNTTPGQLVFGRDMIFNIKHDANWGFIRKRKQQLIEKNNAAENAKRIPHTYIIHEIKYSEEELRITMKRPIKVLILSRKLMTSNGTVCLKVKDVEDTYNIPRLTPYLGPESIDHGGESSLRTSRAKRKRN